MNRRGPTLSVVRRVGGLDKRSKESLLARRKLFILFWSGVGLSRLPVVVRLLVGERKGKKETVLLFVFVIMLFAVARFVYYYRFGCCCFLIMTWEGGR